MCGMMLYYLILVFKLRHESQIRSGQILRNPFIYAAV